MSVLSNNEDWSQSSLMDDIVPQCDTSRPPVTVDGKVRVMTNAEFTLHDFQSHWITVVFTLYD